MLKMEYLELMGKHATYWINDLEVNVKIIDIKSSYGNIRVLITPIAGNGFTWVNLDSIKLSQ